MLRAEIIEDSSEKCKHDLNFFVEYTGDKNKEIYIK